MEPFIRLDCWVRGDAVESIFPVKIPRNEHVSDLKEAIKEKKSIRLRDVDASDLSLYSVPLDDDEHFEDELIQWNPRDETKLNGRKKLSQLFPEADNREWLIIVNVPTFAAPTVEPSVTVPGTTLNCWVRTDEISHVFEVKISRTETVAALKEAIKNKKPVAFRDVDADTLALYKVSLPCNEDLGRTLEDLKLDLEQFLHPWKILSDIFSGVPLQAHLHIVIEAPLSIRSRTHPPSSIPSLQLHSVEAQRLTFLRNTASMAPSSGGKLKSFATRQAASEQTIFCNRPHAARATIPVTLLHAVFGQFLNECETHEITADDNSFAEELHIAMSNFYPSELARARAIRNILSKWELHFGSTVTDDGYVTDGDISVNGHRYVIAEFKNEVGCTGAEPYHQASLYYLESTRKYATRLGGSPLPCIIVLLFGPYITFAGATWNLRPVIQPLSLTLPMHYHHTDTNIRMKVARHLGAFKKAVHALEEYYRGLTRGTRLASSSHHSHLFPYRTHFSSLPDSHERHFEYLSQPFQDKLLFFGTLPDGQSICIKFVRQYSMDAHLVCASLGCAPTLRGFEEIPGGWFMLIMDRLFREEYIELYDAAPTAPLMSNIRDVLKQLHQNGYVHGDVRDTNILVSKADETKFMLVDFDWAGKNGEVRYPMNVTRTENLWRPGGAVDGALIRTEHDMDMLDEIERRYRIVN